MKNSKKALPYLPSDEVVKMPLSMLTIADSNVRNVEPKNLEGLAQSLLKNGQEQNMSVIPPIEGQSTLYEVVAGKRRYLAFSLLVEQGRISPDSLIDVKVKPRESATVTSLTENFHREPMHPIDEYKAFQKLKDEGLSVLDISLSFGVTELQVRQRLALGSASPELLDEVLAEKMTLSQLMVLCQLDDHVRQNELWFNTPDNWQRSANNLRKLISSDGISLDNKLVAFVGVEVYENAGGTVTRDLFSTSDSDSSITDPQLLKTLANQKLQEFEKELLAQGWKWAQYTFDRDYNFGDRMHNIHMQQREMTAEETVEYDGWQNRSDELEQLLNDVDEDDAEAETLQAEYDELQGKIDTFDASLEFWGEDKSIAGVYFAIGNSGKLEAMYGLVKPEDYKKLQAEKSDGTEREASSTEKEEEMSASLKETLACVRAGAMQAELMTQPRIAMVLLCHTLAVKTFFSQWSGEAFFDIALTSHTGDLHSKIDSFSETVSGKAIDELHLAWTEKLPTSETKLLDALLNFADSEIQELMAYCVSRNLKVHWPHKDATNRYKKLSGLLNTDIKNHWKPTASTFFNRLKKPQIVNALKQANISTDSLNDGMKKGEMAQKAEVLIQQNPDWLPELLLA